MANSAALFDSWKHVYKLPRADRATDILFGDDTPFSNEELQLFCDVYSKHGVQIPWKTGEVAVLDNFLWSHGRPEIPLKAGERRELGVILGMLIEKLDYNPDAPFASRAN
jgi:hypothetical protein